MNTHRELMTTSVSIPAALLDRAKTHAASTYRTFSQYVSFLIDQDLARMEAETERRHEVQQMTARPINQED
jgi:hypothetical protein